MPPRRRNQTRNHAKQSKGDEGYGRGRDSPPSTSSDLATDNSMKQLIGFDLSDLLSYQRFMQLCHAPTDPSCLALFRIAYGALMIGDSIHERAAGSVVARWSDQFQVCRFPLFDSLQPLPVAWMTILHLFMAIGAVGITIGLFFRLSCAMFVLPYWYIFLLDKTVWNNHSYLFGLIATLLFFTDANRQWSIDSMRRREKSNIHIPAWQYGLFRFQLVIVYFMAGIKKLDRDWVQGYSMSSLSHAWVFDPFRYILSDGEIDQYIVHWGGLTLDLTAGFLLYLDKTRWLGTAMVSSFHLMNATMFDIGQFPYVMLCSTMLFYPYDWPKRTFTSLTVSSKPCNRSNHCLYDKDKPAVYHHFFTVFSIVFMMYQCFMPYSHCLTKGYNHWTGGLYGYSWDMMVHNWHTQHIKVKYVSKATGKEGYLDPTAFVSTSRWSSYPDMIKQHAVCMADLLEVDYDIADVEIYMDIWQSMNHRFQQRFVDPSVDLVRVDWSPFTQSSFILPMLNDLEDWRVKLKDISSNQAMYKTDPDWFMHNPDVTFVADFPGMVLDNYIHKDLHNTNITLLAGSAILYNAETRENTTLQVNKAVSVGVGTHKVYVTSDVPACYMYMYMNTTRSTLDRQLTQLNLLISQNKLNIENLELEAKANETLRQLLDLRKERNHQVNQDIAFWEVSYRKVQYIYMLLRNSFITTYVAMESIISGKSMEELLYSRQGVDSSSHNLY